jgi:hypothetical protein
MGAAAGTNARECETPSAGGSRGREGDDGTGERKDIRHAAALGMSSPSP